MASRFRELLRNEYARSLILLIIVIVCIAGFWLGLKAYLTTEYPLLAVASGSMEPTLNEGDLIVVKGGLNASTIVAERETGDIIIFYSPRNHNELIVHRAVDKWQVSDSWKFHTKGDANDQDDNWTVDETDIIGKVVGVVPYVGHIPLFVHTTNGKIVIIILIVILVLLEFVIPTIQEKKDSESEQPKEEQEFTGIGSL